MANRAQGNKVDKEKFLREIMFLGFKKESSKNVYSKTYHDNTKISIDFDKEEILYPKCLIVNDKTSSNFSHSENFVVLECINRLLEKGYRTEHIELEKKWKMGHSPKGGKADIIIYENSAKENVLLIIECKTYGQKYKEELENTIKDGGQLFSYWQQENSAKWLALYCSDYKDNNVIFKSDAVCCTDDNNLIKAYENNKDVLLYKNAYKAEDKFTTWKETYNQKFYPGIIFDESSSAYKIGVQPLRKRNLVALTQEDNISKNFEEILRHNNISDRDNAFNKLCALFICKLVDELTKTEDDVVDFQYKEGTDTYESLIDRLQHLYHTGMSEFMKEEVFYIPADYVQNTFMNYTGSNREETIGELNRMFRNLKFYSNNDFSFKDVHNEELFYQNGKILVEIVALFQQYRIIYNKKQQFLGDLFEKLLNNGFKQNEGQFFTPTPIAKFMWQSLPLEKFSQSTDIFPKILDYSCGAGHFLTEGIDIINDILNSSDNHWVQNSIYGIEKDYRLARVSKISLFMNGVGNGNIIYGDGLDNYEDKGIKNESFDYIVANPPYAIKEFKRHLKLKNNKLDLLNEITDDSDNIELLFIERTIQLLNDGGYCAIILPTQVLYGEDYSSARKLILQSCKIVSICYMASGVFSATPQSTIILFLQKNSTQPKFSEIIKDTITAIFSKHTPDDKWKDSEYFNDYLSFIDTEKEDYINIITGGKIAEDIDDASYMYQYKDMNTDDIILSEKEKFYYFCLCYNKEVLVVKSPLKTAELQKFLGYKWQKEEIAFIPSEIKLFGQKYRTNDTLAFMINEYFNGRKNVSVPFDKYCTYYSLNSLIDYNKPKFTGKITSSDFKLNSDYPMIMLKNLPDIEIGSGNSAPAEKYLLKGKHPFIRAKNLNHLDNNNINLSSVDKVDDEGIRNLTLFKRGTIVFPKSGQSINTNNIALLGTDAYCVSHLATIYIPDEKLRKYIFFLLEAINTSNLKEADNSYPTIKKENIQNMLIPNITEKKTKHILEDLISKCEKLNKKYYSTNMTKKEYKEKLFDIFIKANILKKAV